MTPWTAACQASLFLPISWSLPKFMSTELVMLSNQSHPLPPSSLFAFNLSQHQGLFQWVGCWHQVAKVWELQLQHQSFQWRTYLLCLLFIVCLPTKCKLFEYKDLCFAVDILGASVTIHVFDKCLLIYTQIDIHTYTYTMKSHFPLIKPNESFKSHRGVTVRILEWSEALAQHWVCLHTLASSRTSSSTVFMTGIQTE